MARWITTKPKEAMASRVRQHIGTNINSLNQATLSGPVISLPSKAEQARIVDQFETLSTKTQRLESVYQGKLAALEALKKSLLHRTFSGEL
jgi:type I restriction enzyme S subunit